MDGWKEFLRIFNKDNYLVIKKRLWKLKNLLRIL